MISIYEMCTVTQKVLLELSPIGRLEKVLVNNKLVIANNKCNLLFSAQLRDRAVTKISSCQVNTTSRRGIKQLGISFGSIFLLFSYESRQGPRS